MARSCLSRPGFEHPTDLLWCIKLASQWPIISRINKILTINNTSVINNISAIILKSVIFFLKNHWYFLFLWKIVWTLLLFFFNITALVSNLTKDICQGKCVCKSFNYFARIKILKKGSVIVQKWFFTENYIWRNNKPIVFSNFMVMNWSHKWHKIRRSITIK